MTCGAKEGAGADEGQSKRQVRRRCLSEKVYQPSRRQRRESGCARLAVQACLLRAWRGRESVGSMLRGGSSSVVEASERSSE